MLAHEASKSREVSRHAGDAHYGAFSCRKRKAIYLTLSEKVGRAKKKMNTWSVSPRLIVRWKHSHMAATNKIFIIQPEKRIR